MPRLSAKKKYPIHGTKYFAASKSEASIGQALLIFKYKFIHDEKYPYDDTNLRFDFMILNSKETPESWNPNSHHVFIEVKDDDKNYLEDLQEKRNLVNSHDDVLLVVTDNNSKFLEDDLKEAVNIKNLKGKVRALEYENTKLKNLLKKNNIKI